MIQIFLNNMNEYDNKNFCIYNNDEAIKIINMLGKIIQCNDITKHLTEIFNSSLVKDLILFLHIEKDYLPFLAIHLYRYLKIRGCFYSVAEKDMIFDLIADSFNKITYKTYNFNINQKICLYKHINIYFPIENNKIEQNKYLKIHKYIEVS